MANTARRHCVGIDRWSVLFDSKLLVERSRDPECDAARALLARGITGKLTMQDKDGRPLCVINIERAARVTAREGRGAPYFAKYVETSPREAPSPEEPSLGRGGGLALDNALIKLSAARSSFFRIPVPSGLQRIASSGGTRGAGGRPGCSWPGLDHYPLGAPKLGGENGYETQRR